MIFVTVGGQLPFDRLVAAIDNWALGLGRDDVFAQVGNTNQPPDSIGWTRFLTPEAFDQNLTEARVVVSHAGIGTIMKALDLSVPLIVMPRRAEYGEHRNDHQLATATRFGEAGMVHVAQDTHALLQMLGDLDSIKPPTASVEEPWQLIETVGLFVNGCQTRLESNPRWRLRRRPFGGETG